MSSITSISNNQSSYYKNSLASLDKDGNGKISSQEFSLGKPDDVSEAQSNSLFDKLSNGNSDGLIIGQSDSSDSDSDDDDYSAMSDMMSRMMSLMQSMIDSAASDKTTPQNSTEDNPLLKADADNDGKITLAEFLKDKPEGLSDEKATEMFTKMDKDSLGYITTDSIEKPPGPPPGMDESAGTDSSSDTSDDSSDSLLLQTLKSIQDAIDQYKLSIGDNTSTENGVYTL
jgi:Ca2+-binding EF-hand superfamily protein